MNAKVRKVEAPHTVFGMWRVYADGTIKAFYQTPSGRESELHIYPERLAEPDLFLSMISDGVTADWQTWAPAYLLACRLAGFQNITITTFFD